MITPSQLQDLRSSLPEDTAENVNLREDLLIEARKLLLALERPDNVVERVCFQTVETVTISIAIKMGVFELMKDGELYASRQIAQKTNADQLLINRILRTLASFGAVDQEGNDRFRANVVSRTFSEYRNQAAVEHCLEFLTPGWLKLPDYLKEINYQSPSQGADTAFNRAYNQPAGKTLWEILSSTSHVQAAMTYIGNFNEGHKDWLEFYPIEKRLGQGADTGPNAVMMVDVGGGFGSQAINLKKAFPNLPGRFIVQDLAHVLPKDGPDGIEFMVHDFEKEQPIQGARLYYLRYVPHDWPQDFVVNLMTHLRKAMKPGYSRLIVNEWVLPEKGASKFMMAQDMNMMSIGGGMERTEALHRDYLERAGLKLVQVFAPGDNFSESVIEAEVA